MERTNVAFQRGPGCFELWLATVSRTVLIVVADSIFCPSKIIAVMVVVVVVVAIAPLLRFRAVGIVATEIRQDFVRRQVNVVHSIRVNLST